MKIGKFVWPALAAAFLLTGCSGFWQAPNSSTTTTTTTTATSGKFYVLNVAASQIAGFFVNAGALTVLPGPNPTATAPIAITVAPNNAFLYVSTLDGIFVYTIASNGALTLGNSSQAISSDPATSMQVDSTGNWLIAAVSGSSDLHAIRINSSTGVNLSTTEPPVTLPASSIQKVAVSPDNTYVFVAMGAGGTATIPFTAANANPFGKVSTIPVKNTGGAALSVAVDPVTSTTTTPRLFYVGETVATSGTNSGGLRVFDFSTLTTTLKEIPGSPYSISGLAPYSILPFSSGDFVYVLSRQVSGSTTGVIAGFSVSETNSTFALTQLGSTFSVGTHPVAMVEDSSKTFIFAIDFDGSPDLKGYIIDSTNAGYLDTVFSKSTGTDPVEASAIAALH